MEGMTRDKSRILKLPAPANPPYSGPVALDHDKPTPLPIQGILAPGPRNYDITPDGKYFVTVFPGSQANGGDKAPFERINITLNWFEELKQRVPVH